MALSIETADPLGGGFRSLASYRMLNLISEKNANHGLAIAR